MVRAGRPRWRVRRPQSAEIEGQGPRPYFPVRLATSRTTPTGSGWISWKRLSGVSHQPSPSNCLGRQPREAADNLFAGLNRLVMSHHDLVPNDVRRRRLLR